jgi:hypothetical protein
MVTDEEIAWNAQMQIWILARITNMNLWGCSYQQCWAFRFYSQRVGFAEVV